MTIRRYNVHLSLPSDGQFVNLSSATVKARNKKEAKLKAAELAKEKQAEVLAVATSVLVERFRKRLRAAHRNINPHLRPAFDLKYRHKGRPIKGRRNTPHPKRGLSITISNVEL